MSTRWSPWCAAPPRIDADRCAWSARTRFGPLVMASGYLNLYRSAMEQRREPSAAPGHFKRLTRIA
jgi:hypothetical protein